MLQMVNQSCYNDCFKDVMLWVMVMVSGNGTNWPVRMVVIWNNFGDELMQVNLKAQKSKVFCVESHWVAIGPLLKIHRLAL